jgi:phage/plasmid-associated DNA primase
MELIEEFTYNDEAVNIIKNHIKILCGNDDVVASYFEKWIAQMIQYPAVKTICPTLISKEGAGKGTLLQLLTKMLGSTKVFETTQPSRDVWGEFNGLMADAFLVNLNELSKKETVESEGRIKGLITDPTMKINNKGVSQFPINSFHRFIITTNNEEPIATSKDDRRKLIIRSSDELCGNKEYFKKMYELLDDTNAIKSVYEYFKSIPDMDKFGSLPMPTTEHQENLKEMNANPIESWLKDFVERKLGNPTIKETSKKLYEDFHEWINNSNITNYQCDALKFSVRLKNLKLPYITKDHTKYGNTNVFDIEGLSKHYGVGCLIAV